MLSVAISFNHLICSVDHKWTEHDGNKIETQCCVPLQNLGHGVQLYVALPCQSSTYIKTQEALTKNHIFFKIVKQISWK
jgi:hypothetical protein